MKKVILSLGLLAGMAGAAQAQATFGLKAGASLTNFSGTASSTLDKSIFGFNGGVLANFAVNDLFSVQPEVLFSMKGAKAEGSILGTSYTATARLNYIDVPVLAHINAGGLFFEAGPQVGFLASANGKTEVAGQSTDQDIKDEFNSVAFGYAAGLGYQMMPGVGIGLRYNGDFTRIEKNNTSGSSNSDNTRNNAFQLYVTYLFGGK